MIAVVSTSMVAVSSAFAEPWASIGPDGGAVHRFAVDPGDPSRVLALSWSPLWPLFESTDGGRSWSPFGAGLKPGRAIAIAPSSRSRVYVGAGTGQVYRSFDGGATFQTAGDPLPGLDPWDITTIAVDPESANVVLVGTYGHHGLFRSTDGGATWSPPVTANLPWTISNIAADPDDAGTFYAAGSSTTFLSRSTDGGVSWAEIGSTISVPGASATIGTWDVLPVAGTLLAVAKGIPFKDDVVRSTDGGATWAASSSGLETLGGGIRLQRDPATGALFVLDSFRALFTSIDEGEAWLRWEVREPIFTIDLALTHQGFGDVEPLVGGLLSGPQHRRGGEWLVGRGYHAANASLALTLDRLYAVTVARAFRSDDRGATWVDLAVPEGAAPYLAAADAADPDHLIMASSARVHATTDGGDSWAERLPGQAESDSIQQLQATRLPGTFLLNGSETFRRTTDGGLTWPEVGGLPLAVYRRLFTDAAGLASYLALGFSMGPEALYRSTDSGATWIPTGADLSALPIAALGPSPLSPLVVYLASGADVLRSTDGGSTWVPTGAALPGTVAHLHVDRSARLWAAIEPTADVPTVWSSADAGAHWQAEDVGAGVSVREISSLPGAVYVATNDSGAFRRDLPIAFFSDGFESGTTEAWTSSLP